LLARIFNNSNFSDSVKSRSPRQEQEVLEKNSNHGSEHGSEGNGEFEEYEEQIIKDGMRL